MKGNNGKSTVSVFQNGSSQSRDQYTVLVPIQDSKQFSILLPPAFDLATKHSGRILLLNIIEIPYQLPPSTARKFILERELFLRRGMEMLERAECRGSTAVRIAHDTNNAIKRFSKNENVNIIIREYDLEGHTDTMFNRLKKRIKGWF